MGRRGNDPYAGRRAEDTSGYWVAAFFGRITWPLALFAVALLAIVTAVYFKYGETTALRYLAFLRGPLAAAVGSLLVVCVGAVISKIPQWARMDRRTGAIQQQLNEDRAVSAQRVDNLSVFIREVSGKVDRLDERLDALGDGVVARRIEDAVGRFEVLAARQSAHVGRAVATITGQVPAQSVAPPEPSVLPEPVVVPSGAHPVGPADLPDPEPERPENPWGPRGPVAMTDSGAINLPARTPAQTGPQPSPEPAQDPLDISQPWPGYDMGHDDTLSGKLRYPGAPEAEWPNHLNSPRRTAQEDDA